MTVLYTVRANALEPERTWELADDALCWNSKHGPQKFAFDKITDLRMQWAPTRVNADQFECHVSVASGWREIIPSTHYAGFNDFQGRAADYRRFVTELLRRVAAANPACRVHLGQSPVNYYGNAALVMAAVVLLAGVVALVGMPWLAILGVLMAAALALKPIFYGWFWANRPQAMTIMQALRDGATEQWLPQLKSED